MLGAHGVHRRQQRLPIAAGGYLRDDCAALCARENADARRRKVLIERRKEENERRVPALYYLDAECERDAPDFAVERELLERLRELEAWRDGGRLDELRRIEEGGR